MLALIRASILFFLLFSATALGQREGWTRPPYENWKKPCLIQWQRNLEDAIALSKQTGRHLLVCVNMDEEAASENYAGVRYRDPEFAKLANAYIPVIVSINVHNARDYDETGRRLPCPRFTNVVCSEHVQIEGPAFDKYFDGRRLAPRHIGVSPDGKTLFDCFLNSSATPVLKALRENLPPVRPSDALSGAPVASRVRSRDSLHRNLVESTYVTGSLDVKNSLLAAAATAKGFAPFDLIRLGMREQDAKMQAKAVEALIATADANAVPLLADALRFSADPPTRKQLVDLLDTLGKADTRARTLAMVHRAITAKSKLLDTEKFIKNMPAAPPPTAASLDPDELEKQIGQLSALARRSTDPKHAVDMARAALDFADHRLAMGKDPQAGIADAVEAIQIAVKNNAESAEFHLQRVRLSILTGSSENFELDLRQSIPRLAERAGSREIYAPLTELARMLHAKINDAQKAGREWPAELLTDAHAAYQIAEAHPLLTPDVVYSHYNLLVALDADGAAVPLLSWGLQKFPGAALLHERTRARILKDYGVHALESEYKKITAAAPESAPALWFSAYAAVAAAEHYKLAGNDEAAKAAYGRAIQTFEASAARDEKYVESVAFQIAMALAGRARIAMENGDLAGAVTDIVAGLARWPETLLHEDGLGRAPQVTLNALRWHLEEKGDAALRDKLESELEKIDTGLASRPAQGR